MTPGLTKPLRHDSADYSYGEVIKVASRVLRRTVKATEGAEDDDAVEVPRRADPVRAEAGESGTTVANVTDDAVRPGSARRRESNQRQAKKLLEEPPPLFRLSVPACHQ
jgi:hypothetical protein